jgi:hypothetical protein
MADLFLSYSREDSERAGQIAAALEADGFDVFWDKEIPAGQTWADFIENKLNNSHAVVVLWTEVSTKSQWVREEARMGRDKDKLIPVQLDGAMPPFGFGEVQAANLSGWAGDRQSTDWQRLVNAIRFAIEKAGKTPPAPKVAPALPPPPPPPRAQGFQAPQGLAKPQPARAASPSEAPAKAGGIPKPVWWIGGICAVLLVLGVIGIMAENSGPPQPAIANSAAVPTATGPAQSMAGASSAAATGLAGPVQAVVNEASAAFDEAVRFAGQGTQYAQQASQAASAAQAGANGLGVQQLPNGSVIAGDVNSAMAGRPAMLGMATPNGIQFYGQYQEYPGGYAMYGAAGWGQAQASGNWLYTGNTFTFQGQAAISGRYSWGGNENGSGTSSTGVGAVSYPDGRRYLGQYRTVGEGDQMQLFMHGLGALYAANGGLLQSGRWDSDRLAAPQ